MFEKLEQTVDTMIWQAGFKEALSRMAYWLAKEWGCKTDTALRLCELIETDPVDDSCTPDNSGLAEKRRLLALPIEERREALRKQAADLLRDNPDYGVEEA